MERGGRTGLVEHASVSSVGARLHHRRIGEGPDALVCLHGFPQTGRMWERLGRLLAPRFTVIAPDLRGCGESERSRSSYDKKTMAGDVHDLVRALGFGSVRLVGHDIGAAVAYAYAAQWPREVSHLALIEMLLPGFGLEDMFAIRRPGEFAHTPFFMAADVPEWLVTGREAAFLEWFTRNMVSDQAALAPDDIAANVSAYSRPGALRAAFDMYRAFWQDAEDNRSFAASRLPMPVLAVGADGSLGRTLERSLGPLAANLHGLVFEQCGHFVPDEQPERLARELQNFFGAPPGSDIPGTGL